MNKMSKKKYAIVRVDNHCPSWCGDNPKLDYIVCDLKNKNCKNCRYGDTKEQLVVKVAQILKQQMFILEVYEDYIEAAKNIVEFLGVIE